MFTQRNESYLCALHEVDPHELQAIKDDSQSRVVFAARHLFANEGLKDPFLGWLEPHAHKVLAATAAVLPPSCSTLFRKCSESPLMKRKVKL